MINLQMFTTEDDLMKLTGLSHDELWENDFDLDDWDVGFVSDVPLTETVHDDDDNDEYEDPADDAWWLVYQMDGYCVGYAHIEYRGRHYYIVHHASWEEESMKVVHHKNHIRDDNRIENLELMTFKEHAGMHMKERWEKRKENNK